MIELHNMRPDSTRRYNKSRNYIKKFNNVIVDENGNSKSHEFEPEYDLILYVYSTSPSKAENPFTEYEVQYGYLYQKTYSGIECFPVFREKPTGDKRKIGVWKVYDSDWQEMEVFRVSTNFYAYSFPENRDLNKFLEGAIKVIDDHKDKITKKYERDIENQNKVMEKITETMTEMID